MRKFQCLSSYLTLGQCCMIVMLTIACRDKMEVGLDCVSGVIVGQKCSDYALKLDKKGALGAADWQKKINKANGETEYISYENVIGLLNLPEEYRQEGLRLFVKLRSPTEEESVVPCYLDMPNPPKPVYVVVAVDSVRCPVIP